MTPQHIRETCSPVCHKDEERRVLMGCHWSFRHSPDCPNTPAKAIAGRGIGNPGLESTFAQDIDILNTWPDTTTDYPMWTLTAQRGQDRDGNGGVLFTVLVHGTEASWGAQFAHLNDIAAAVHAAAEWVRTAPHAAGKPWQAP